MEVEFVKAGSVAMGDQPEVHFFRVDGAEIVVGISGDALRHFQRARRYLTRERKIDLAGLFLKQQIKAGAALAAGSLFVGGGEAEALARDPGIAAE